MIKRIDSIKNMAVFQGFQWASSMRDDGNNIGEFKKINILYGRNYSGKTTLSRIIRSLETGAISDKYSDPEFQLSFGDGSHVNQNALGGHGQVIRVFNEDFIKENLRFIVDDEQGINSFAILGEDNTKIEEEIRQHEAKLGNEKDQSGLINVSIDADEKFKKASESYKNKQSDLDSKLRNKANNDDTGIKHDKLFGDANYNINRIKSDIDIVIKKSYVPLTDEQVRKFHNILTEKPKNEISESASFNLKYSTIASKARELIEKKIQASELIQELVNDAALAAWVRTGKEQHQRKKDKCAFCGNDLPSDLWEKLDKHFNQESEELRKSLDKLLALIESERVRTPGLLKIKESEFYSDFTNELDLLKENYSTCSASYCKQLDLIEEQIKKRKNDIFTPLSFDEPSSVEGALNSVRDSFEQLRSKSNKFTVSLSAEQSKARVPLRLHEVYKFITDIKYDAERKDIDSLKKAMDMAEKDKIAAKKNVNNKRNEIIELKAKLKNESKGAERVNEYLNNFFGHQHLSLKSIEENQGNTSQAYRFEVTRNEKKRFT